MKYTAHRNARETKDKDHDDSSNDFRRKDKRISCRISCCRTKTDAKII